MRRREELTKRQMEYKQDNEGEGVCENERIGLGDR